MNLYRRWCIIFTRSLLKTERREIGLQFDFSVASPFLKIGMTLEISKLLRNIPDTKDSLMKRVISLEMGVSRIFRSLTDLPFGPLELPSFNDCIREDTSF